jgi:hypothetical protein
MGEQGVAQTADALDDLSLHVAELAGGSTADEVFEAAGPGAGVQAGRLRPCRATTAAPAMKYSSRGQPMIRNA